MGVYLPNIDIPKESRLTLQISADGTVYVVNSCSITAETYTTDAVPVPSHGRLIDADDFEKRIKRWTDHPNDYIRQRNRDMLYYVQQEATVIEAEEASDGSH